ISVKEGQAVKKGEPLFLLSPAFDKNGEPARVGEVKSAKVKAPFDGLVGRMHEQVGSLVKEGDVLTTLSDHSVMWVYFNVPDRRYLEYMASSKLSKEDPKIELELADHEKFPERCQRITVEAQFNDKAGNIPFRADFPNPDGLLRHGQSGTI